MRIAVVTGSRGDRGALEEVYLALEQWDRVFGAMHLVHNVRWIDVTPGIEVKHSSDAASVSGIACATVAGDLAAMPAHLVVLLGDRHEIVGAALGANLMHVPIAHLSGGDLTEGSQDDCFRHAITKLSHLHFPTNKAAASRLISMGEDPSTVTVAGWPCLDKLARTPLPDRNETFDKFDIHKGLRAILVSFHPNTLGDTEAELDELVIALNRLQQISVVLIEPNHDAGNELIRKAWTYLESMGRDNRPVHYLKSLPQEDFWALMSHCDLLLGNSSAGFYEAPSMALPVINVGDRQQGRIPTTLLFGAPPVADKITRMLNLILDGECKVRIPIVNPYGDGRACEQIVDRVAKIRDPQALLRKAWYEPETTGEHW